MTAWAELKPVLVRLREQQQVALKLGPDPRNPLLRRTPILPLTVTA